LAFLSALDHGIFTSILCGTLPELAEYQNDIHSSVNMMFKLVINYFLIHSLMECLEVNVRAWGRGVFSQDLLVIKTS